MRMRADGRYWPTLALWLVCAAIAAQVVIRAASADFELATPNLESTTETNSEQETTMERLKQPERVTVIAPKHLRPLSDYHVLVNLANSQAPATVDLQITGAKDSDQELSEVKSILVSSGETQTAKFQVGDWPAGEYTLSINAQAVDRSWNFTQDTVLSYQSKSFSMFIQTDKSVYKPGQLVQFRAIFLSTRMLTPLALKNGEINVTVSDPKGNLVKQWTKLSNWRGLLSLELQLSEDPMLGDWRIRVDARKQSAIKSFKVAEYVLPTFGVEIHLPPYATYNESDIVATVRAQYTYGRPVNGHVTLTVQPLVRFKAIDTRPLEQAQYRSRLTNGSAEINVDLVKDLRQMRELFEREIEFFALVEEDLTGRNYNQTAVIKIHDKSVKVELLNAHKSFKPGLEYLLQLKVAYQDDTPVEDGGQELELRYGVPGRSQLGLVRQRPVGGIVERAISIPRKVELLDDESVGRRSVSPPLLELQVTYRGQVHYLNPIGASASDSEHYMRVSLPQSTRSLRRRKPVGSDQQQQQQQQQQRDVDGLANIGDDLRVRVEATEGMQQVTCQGLAWGDIVWALSADAKNQSSYEFQLQVDQRMAPETRVLCFHVRPENKELIADSVVLAVSGLARNSVRLSASREEAKPGQEVEVKVQTKPNALVGVLGVDQSALLLKSGNDIAQREVDEELRSFGSARLPPEFQRLSSGRENTESLLQSADVVVLTNNLVYNGLGFLEGRLLYANGIYAKKTLSAVPENNKIIALSSLILDHELNPPEFKLDAHQEQQPIVVRSFFPETWIWHNATANADGSVSIKSRVPDTIGSWILSAFSMSESHGFGLSLNKHQVRVFRPFFVKLNLPYSIIRGETVSIQAVVFNYGKRPTTARVSLTNARGEFEFVEAANSIDDEKRSSRQVETRVVKVPAEDGVSVSFLITPTKLGSIDIQVSAQGESAGDGVLRKLLVRPEGQTQHMNQAMLFNLQHDDRATRNVSIQIPANAVAGSQKVFVSAVGDVLGAGLSNVDDMLRLPYGCGEQNMINLVPNIVILNYLRRSNRLRPVQQALAVRNIETGYQRQLNYRRRDGSFSAFGDADNNGSVWLTAYVLKTLQQAKSAVEVDEKVVKRAANYLARHSRADGSIEEEGMLHNKELRSLGDSSTYLTAYSMIAFLQKKLDQSSSSSGDDLDHSMPEAPPLSQVLDKGLDLLERKVNEAASASSPYDLAIITYTLLLANSNKRQQSADRAYDLLWSKAERGASGGSETTWWSNEGRKRSRSEDAGLSARLELEGEVGESDADTRTSTSTIPPLKQLPVSTKQSAHLFLPDSLTIEMTALALMSTVIKGDLERALPIVNWLVGQQNSNGGFASTQDTVLAFEAIAAFAEASNKNSSGKHAIDLELIYPRGTRKTEEGAVVIRRNQVDQMLITKSNALVQQQLSLPGNISWVQVDVSGSGVAVVQVHWQYNLLVSAERPAFYLSSVVDRSSTASYLQLSICTFYKGAGDASNMAVMEVELPSGYVADVESLPGLRRAKNIKRVDTTQSDTKVIIYIDSVSHKDELCLTLPAHRVNKVSNNKPVPVSIYDYYDRRQAARVFYEPPAASSCDICDSESCGQSCGDSTGGNKSDKLKSLHEQRNHSNPKTKQTGRSNANLTITSDATSPTPTGIQLLPLAPVLMSFMTVIRNLQQQ